MLYLIAGLVIFLGVHSINLFAHGWRNQCVGRWGAPRWKGLYALIAIVGFILIVWGYGQARLEPVWYWIGPAWTRHLAALLMLPAFIFLVAAYVPGNRIKARVGHPMLLATKTWALAHLFVKGTLASVLLFGGFLIWAVAGYIIYRRRDRASGRQYPVAGASRDVAVLVLGAVLWVVFSLWGHSWLIGVKPFG